MRTFRLIGMTLLMIMLTVNFTACSDDDDNELSLPVDNTLELLIGTWEGTGEVEGEILRAIPMNYIEVEQFFGCICYIQLQKVEGGYIILEIIKEEESV